MKTDTRLIALILLFAATLVAFQARAGSSASTKPKLLWITKDLSYPESPVYDPRKDVIYVSNMGSMDIRETGHGFISKLSPDGKIIEREWVTGLLAPNGINVRGNRLYVVDLRRLLVIDTDSGKII